MSDDKSYNISIKFVINTTFNYFYYYKKNKNNDVTSSAKEMLPQQRTLK